ncbi:MAG: glycoside hydrolase family 6 protein, partial [Chloroflexota bacterium]|nr:glycoside hydrolase family 6 protein [Chloroflexota bacterium]
QPQAVWLGSWSEPVEATVKKHCDAAKAKGQTPIFALYMIPGRDMGGFSAGGSKTPEEYRTYVDGVARGLSTPAIVVLEPDAVVHDANPERVALISYAVTTLSATGSKVYIDAGHPRWHAAQEMAHRLHLANVKNAAGFALNTSNFVTTELCHAYGDEIVRRLAALGDGTKGYVVDTSRNGNPTMPETWDWANPANRWLGHAPTTQTGHAGCDAYLFVKAPGESDGWSETVHKPAGQFDVTYALGLVRASTA